MITGYLSDIIRATQAKTGNQVSLDNITFQGISIDTRTLESGNIYIAIVGEQHDGHQFIEQAIAQGAVALIVSKPVESSSVPQFLVDDTILALGQLASWWRQQFDIPIVGITGSCGKTTTKQMLGAILAQQAPTLISQGNYNNYFGVPLSLFDLNAEHRFAVIEMGTDRPGEIEYLTRIVQPTVAVITTVAPVHIEGEHGSGFGNIEAIFAEKSQIFSHWFAGKGVAIINADNEFYPQWQTQLAGKPYLSFGLTDGADISAKNISADKEQYYQFNLQTPVGAINIHLSTMGRHNINNALAAVAVAVTLKVDLNKIQQGLFHIPLAPHRMQRFYSHQALIIDDCYNANPQSVLAVIDLLADFSAYRIMVFADMLELGDLSVLEHQRVGQYAKQRGIDCLLAYGLQSRYAVEAFGQGAEHFSEQADLLAHLRAQLKQGTVVAVKGSFGMKLYQIIERLKQET